MSSTFLGRSYRLEAAFSSLFTARVSRSNLTNVTKSDYQMKSTTPASSQTIGWYMQTWLSVYQPLASSHRRFGKSKTLFRRRSRLLSVTRCFSRHLPSPSMRSPTRWSTSLQMSLTRSLRSSDALVVHPNLSQSGFPTRRSLQNVHVVGWRGRWKSIRGESDRVNYRLTCHRSNRLINESRRAYFHRRLSDCTDSGQQWRVGK